jgi:hypothetical protein
MKNCAAPRHGQATSLVGWLVGVVAVVASACANGGSSADNPGFGPQTGSGGSGRDAAASASGSSSSGGGGSNGGSDDGGGTPQGGDDATASDDGSGDEGAGDDAAGDAAGDDGAATDSGTGGDDAPSSAPPSYACVTTLASPLPVCDSAHDYCLCTQDTQCNSHGLNGGGCHSGKCSGADCSGGQISDSAGCSVVGTTCNINKCPTGTTCEGGPTSGWNKNSDKDLCGTSLQCCWCTSDSACPVSGKCINDSTKNQCSGAGPCTGSGTDFDGMHCQLASPGIPMCSTQ